MHVRINPYNVPCCLLVHFSILLVRFYLFLFCSRASRSYTFFYCITVLLLVSPLSLVLFISWCWEVFVPYGRVFEVKEHLSHSEVKYVVSEVHCDHQVVTTAECYHDQYAFAPVVSCSMTRPFTSSTLRATLAAFRVG